MPQKDTELAGLVRLGKELAGNMQTAHYQLQKLQQYRDALFEMSDFQVGDHAALNRTPEISRTKNFGWIGGKHFLLQGAVAEVVELDWYCGSTSGDFQLGVKFEDESTSLQRTPVPAEKRSLFWMPAAWFSPPPIDWYSRVTQVPCMCKTPTLCGLPCSRTTVRGEALCPWCREHCHQKTA